MPGVWDDAREKRLLLEVIAICNPTVDRSAWEGVAAVMGDGTTAEACRQKFQGIKRNLKSANGTTNPSTPSKASKSKTPNGNGNGNGNGSKGRKRKAASANLSDPADDEEPLPKAAKIKTEARSNDAGVFGAEVFKAEEGEGVDVERDDLYSDNDAA